MVYELKKVIFCASFMRLDPSNTKTRISIWQVEVIESFFLWLLLVSEKEVKLMQNEILYTNPAWI